MAVIGQEMICRECKLKLEEEEEQEEEEKEEEEEQEEEEKEEEEEEGEEEEEEKEEEVSLCDLLPDAPSWQQPITEFFAHQCSCAWCA